jgi:AcrR family transcriptional regulator
MTLVAPPPRPKKPSRVEKKALTRARLIEAAATVFARRGFAAASLDEVAEEAGLTKGAVYSNFESKDELITELLHERLNRQAMAIEASVAPEGSAEEQAALSGSLFMRGLAEERDAHLLAAEFSIHLARNPELRERFSRNTREMNAWMTRTIEEHADKRGQKLPLPPEELALGLSALGQGIALAWLSDPDTIPDDLFGKMLTVILRQEADPPRTSSSK